MEVQAAPAAAPATPRFRNRLLASLAYLWTTEVHAFAFSIAANALLSFFPFCLLLVTLCHSWLRWQDAYDMSILMLRDNLPTGGEFIIRNLNAVMHARQHVAFISALLLFVTSSGVFLPLEVALNKIWGISRDRNYVGNMVVSVMLAVGAGVMSFASVASAAVVESIKPAAPANLPLHDAALALSRAALFTVSIPLLVAIYFTIYYFLPNDRVPAARVLPAAVLGAVLTEVVRIVYTWILPWLHFPEVYGPFALSATLLIWSFLGSLILLWCAAFFAYGYELGPVRGQRARQVQTGMLGLEA